MCFGVVVKSIFVDTCGFASIIVSVHVCSGTFGVAVEGRAFCSSSQFVDILVVVAAVSYTHLTLPTIYSV